MAMPGAGYPNSAFVQPCFAARSIMRREQRDGPNARFRQLQKSLPSQVPGTGTSRLAPKG